MSATEVVGSLMVLAATNPRQSVYFASQAAEKVGKAILCSQGIDPPKKHDFEVLASRFPEGHSWKARIADLEDLPAVSIESRYPSVTGELLSAPEPVGLKEILDMVGVLLADAQRELGL